MSDSGVPFVDLGAQYASLRTELHAAIDGVLDRGDFILGESVAMFEREMAAFCGTRHAVGVDSGTSGLELALEAYGIGAGDEVITAANTFIATALAISHVGATPVLVDIVPGGYLLDPAAVEDAITPATRAIIPVHLYGYPMNLDPVMEIASRHDLVVIEDASQAHGARYRGRRVGSVGHAAVFSLYPAKNLGAFGDAGVIVTDDSEIDAALRLARNYGSPVKYHHLSKGHNRRLDTLQAAILRVKLPYLDEWNAARRQHAARYDRLLAGVETPPEPTHESEPVYHLYVIRSSHRDALQQHLRWNGVATVIHYPIPIHLQPAYADLGYPEGSFPVTEQYASEVLSLPMFPHMTSGAVDRVAEAVAAFDPTARQTSDIA